MRWKAAAVPTRRRRAAQTDTMLSPRFYTTDFEAMDRLNVDAVRSEWDAMIGELRADHNKAHFRRTEPFDFDLAKACPRICALSSSIFSSVR